ncbi:IclR family transcriptional regulator [Sulfitobacter guttiformis]|uniref:IclR family transcriptional regulator n=1 Tax=Sulfitobacter guttiformis TaxID=74349 RepID=J7FXV1_9RHOB|nr:IclR family transcriptional regulator [Sulfitobacter guttiformis]AFP55445.1 transcriptional regulator, IclR family protein [Sulfitobacter guttiformis]KIN75427.1 Transcriptional regulator, IclR family protein [Sulfitobacter guttiformis KCTC 32187]RKE92067.1 IclR family transcriptional regulator [Sulfitobacter guttiformis]
MEFDPELESKDRNFVTALARGLEILRCFRRGDLTLTNSDFSERTGLPKATISRLTHTLCELDYLVADARVGTYRLSAGVLRLGFSRLAAMDMRDRAKHEMHALRMEGPNPFVTVSLGEQHRTEVIYLATECSTEEVTLMVRVGTRLPLFRSAIGKAILAVTPEDRCEQIFGFARAEGPEIEVAARERYKEAVSEYATYGYCLGYGNWRPDVNGIAVPVHSLSDGRIYGLNVGGPSYRVKPKQLEAVYAERLLKVAASLSINE